MLLEHWFLQRYIYIFSVLVTTLYRPKKSLMTAGRRYKSWSTPKPCLRYRRKKLVMMVFVPPTRQVFVACWVQRKTRFHTGQKEKKSWHWRSKKSRRKYKKLRDKIRPSSSSTTGARLPRLVRYEIIIWTMLKTLQFTFLDIHLVFSSGRVNTNPSPTSHENS